MAMGGYGGVWRLMQYCPSLQTSMYSYGSLWNSMDGYGRAWRCMEAYGILSIIID